MVDETVISEARQALADVHRLQEEKGTIEGRIKEAAQGDAQRKSVAARNGQPVSEVVDEAPALVRRRDDLPYEIWAAQMRLHHANIAAAEERAAEKKAEADELKPVFELARANHEKAVEELRKVENEYRGALSVYDRFRWDRKKAVDSLNETQGRMPGKTTA